MAGRPQINQVNYDFASLEAAASGLILAGIKSADYGNSRETANVEGAGRVIYGKTPGLVLAKDATIVVLKSTYLALIGVLGPGYMFKEFPLIFSYGFKGQPTIKDELRGCSIIDDGRSYSRGPDALEETIQLAVTTCIMNGIDPANVQPGEGGVAVG